VLGWRSWLRTRGLERFRVSGLERMVHQMILDTRTLVELGVAEVLAGELGVRSQLLLDPHQLVVFGQTF